MTPDSTEDDTLRAFVAFEVPDEIKQRLADEASRLRRELPSARWVRAAGLHLTVKFLGSVERARLDALNDDLRAALLELSPVRFRLGGAGFFPNPRRPRVAWVGGSADGVEPVVDRVDAVAADHGFDRERRRWTVHLTLARLKKPWPPPATERWIEWGQRLDLPPFAGDELICFSSELRPDGAVYHPVQRITLGVSR